MPNQRSWIQKLLITALVGSFILLATISKQTQGLGLRHLIPNVQEEITQGAGKNHLDRIKQRGYLICGVNGTLPGFSFVNAEGEYAGIDVDLCRAIAAAIFDDPHQVRFLNLNATDRFKVLKSGDIDLLSRNTTQTLSRDTQGNLEFTPPIFYDAQGIMVNQKNEISQLSQLENQTICVPEETTSYYNLQDYLHQTKISATILASANHQALFDFYEHNQCQAITGDISQLITRRTLLANPQHHVILSQTISQEPLAPLLLHHDSQWFDVVKWVTFALIQAEELNITSENLNIYRKTRESDIRKFLGMDSQLGSQMGLTNDFTKRIVKHVGNYSEIYERNLGRPFRLPRGKNALWKDGGLMYSPPFN